MLRLVEHVHVAALRVLVSLKRGSGYKGGWP